MLQKMVARILFMLSNVFGFMSWKQVIGAQEQNIVSFVTPPNEQNFELNFWCTSPLHMKWIHLIAPIAQVQLTPSLQWCASFFVKLLFTFCKFPTVRRIRLVSEQKISVISKLRSAFAPTSKLSYLLSRRFFVFEEQARKWLFVKKQTWHTQSSHSNGGNFIYSTLPEGMLLTSSSQELTSDFFSHFNSVCFYPV